MAIRVATPIWHEQSAAANDGLKERMSRTQHTYRFKVGDEFTLDSIFHIQGLAGGNWWEKIPDGGADLDMSEFCRCTRDVKIIVIVETPGPGARAEPRERPAQLEN